MPALRRTPVCVALSIAAFAPARANALGRNGEPVVLTGAGLPAFLGSPPSRLVAFRYAGGWRAVPVQVDERAVVDFGTVYDSTPRGATFLAYADTGTFTGADPDPTFDADDEVALRAEDAGGRVDGLDLSRLGRAFGSCSLGGAPPWWDAVDYTRDGCVGGDDLSFLAAASACRTGEDLCRR